MSANGAVCRGMDLVKGRYVKLRTHFKQYFFTLFN